MTPKIKLNFIELADRDVELGSPAYELLVDGKSSSIKAEYLDDISLGGSALFLRWIMKELFSRIELLESKLVVLEDYGCLEEDEEESVIEVELEEDEKNT